ncbi:MAG: tRNA preQ1(34) S-adenosylmethionine ribosyltransferase-isomerase QueA [Actinobacteria bacterium]|nr:tRNA preQ1(34) S-adenosylmethionine ribosyltransferase-isomerase QueA [Actinomycetota bacterium]
MKTSILDYNLPEELIAQEPIEPRDHSRLMVVNRESGEIAHDYFYNLTDYLKDCLIVFNDSMVFPARMVGRLPTGGRVEVLLLRKVEEGLWRCLVKPARKFKEGKEIVFNEKIKAIVREYLGKGERLLEFVSNNKRRANDQELKETGQVPLPPYIKKEIPDAGRYQTVYAKEEGSVAAPTAGLHFTPSLIERLKENGNTIVYITLHVGTFTFKPIQENEIEEHRISEEIYEINEYEAETINEALRQGKRLVAVGTTTVRALESASKNGIIIPGKRTTDLFIYPGYKFKVVKSMITNFHLPRTTLLALVYAFGGVELMKRAYLTAVEKRYRFYSFGDAMLII